ncbi:MAG: hypothetical protein HY796_07600 [Elusimicrobia bacterium]|nr:hypothetical protein [Elusimicrobiota bacterium]
MGKGGNIVDLKSSEPAIPKLNTASEFSLSGKRLSGGTSELAKQSTVLPASASSAKTPADASLVLSANSQTKGGPANAAPATAKAAAAAPGIDPGFSGCFCKGTDPNYFIDKSPSVPNQAACPNACCRTYGLLCPSGDCGPYDTKKSCCINKKVVNKFKTPDKTLQSVGVIPDCKNRIQAVSEKIVKPEKQGCSITPAAARLINIKERRFANPGKVIKFLHLDSGRPLITDFNDPFKGLTPLFSGPCNTHDWCYGTCRKNANDAADRRKCNDQLLKNLKDNVCANAKYPVTREECNELAGDIYNGLRWPVPAIGGPAAFASAQIDHCKCDLCP